jgi:hypothetical protein
MISLGRLWWLFRRDLQRGWQAAYHDYVTVPKIFSEWSWAYWAEPSAPVPVHVLTGYDDWRLCAWMLTSFYHATKVNWHIRVHDDGTLPGHARSTMRRMFRNIEFIDADVADDAVRAALAPYPLCAEYRNQHPLARKIFDMPLFCPEDRLLILDSDILFFSTPEEVLAWCRNANDGTTWFNEDANETSLVPPDEARDRLGISLWPRVNSGLVLLNKATVDLPFCEQALASTSILKGHPWRVEQTLFALCASRAGAGGLLPKSYEVSLGKSASPKAVARHYVGAVRNQFYSEGVNRLQHSLVVDEA